MTITIKIETPEKAPNAFTADQVKRIVEDALLTEFPLLDSITVTAE